MDRFTGYSAAVDEVAPISRRRFDREYAQTGRPCVFRGLLSNSAAVRRWDLSAGSGYLRDRLSNMRVDVIDSGRKKPRGYEVEFDEYLGAVLSRNARAERLYMAQTVVPAPIAKDLRAPIYVGTAKRVAPKFWLGPRSARTLLHRDREHNVLCQIAGRKQVTLYSPVFDDCLYPESLPRHGGQLSGVDVTNPDLSRHPRYRLARSVDVVLQAGDVLFLPIYWWHQTRALDVNISVNFWWAAPFHLWLRADHEALFDDERRFRFELEQHADESTFADDLELAHYLNERGYRILAALCAGSHVKQVRAKTAERGALSPAHGKVLRAASALARRARAILPARSSAARDKASQLEVSAVLEGLSALRPATDPRLPARTSHSPRKR
jgi:hypothetical protein